MTRLISTMTVICLSVLSAAAEETKPATPCDQLVALFVELSALSGEAVSEEDARAEVLAESPTEAECAAMISLFEAQK